MPELSASTMAHVRAVARRTAEKCKALLAEDLCQDLWIVAAEAAGRYDAEHSSGASLETYLHRAIDIGAMDAIRKVSAGHRGGGRVENLCGREDELELCKGEGSVFVEPSRGRLVNDKDWDD